MKARTKRTVLAYAMAVLLALNLLPLSAFAEASDGERTAQAVSDRVSNSPVGSGDDALTDPTANRQTVEAADEVPAEGALDDFSEESSGGPRQSMTRMGLLRAANQTGQLQDCGTARNRRIPKDPPIPMTARRFLPPIPAIFRRCCRQVPTAPFSAA